MNGSARSGPCRNRLAVRISSAQHGPWHGPLTTSPTHLTSLGNPHIAQGSSPTSLHAWQAARGDMRDRERYTYSHRGIKPRSIQTQLLRLHGAYVAGLCGNELASM